MAMSVDQLIVALQRHGVTVPGADHYRALLAAPTRMPEPAVSLLEMTPEDFGKLARGRALSAIMNDPRQHGSNLAAVAAQLKRDLYAEYRDQLAAQADDLILQLRVKFDRAADAARHVRALGIEPEATIEDLFDADDEQRSAWKAFRDRDHKTLDAILHVRRGMSEALGIEPLAEAYGIGAAADEVDWSITVTRPVDGPAGTGWLPPRNPRAPWVRWLSAADSLYLPTLAELASAAVAEAEGLPVELLLLEANRRARLGLGVPETTADPSARVLDATAPTWIPNPPATTTTTQEDDDEA